MKYLLLFILLIPTLLVGQETIFKELPAAEAWFYYDMMDDDDCFEEWIEIEKWLPLQRIYVIHNHGYRFLFTVQKMSQQKLLPNKWALTAICYQCDNLKQTEIIGSILGDRELIGTVMSLCVQSPLDFENHFKRD
jgi:hypothetical protein